MNDTHITIIGGRCTVTTPDGQHIASACDIDRFDAAVTHGHLLRFDYGDVIWYEYVNDRNRHLIRASTPKIKPAKDQNKPERQGRPRGSKTGGVYRKDIPLSVVVALKESGLSGSETARELARRGYGNVSKDYANRKLREADVDLGFSHSGGRPRNDGNGV